MCICCTSTDEHCPEHRPAPATPEEAPPSPSLAYLALRVENLEIMVRDMWERMGRLEDEARRSREP